MQLICSKPTTSSAVPTNCSLAVVQKCPEKISSALDGRIWYRFPSFFFAAGRNWAKWIISEFSDFRSTVLAAQSVVWCKYKSPPPPLLSQPEAEFIPCSSSSFFPFPGGSTDHLPPHFSSGWVQKDYVIDGKKHKKCTQIVATAKTHRFYWVGSSIFFFE